MNLEKLKQLLEKQQFECTLSPAGATIPIDRLLVYFGTDSKKRERRIRNHSK